MRVWKYWKRRCLGCIHTSGVGRDGAGMVQGEMWRLGSGPRRVEGVCVQLQDVGLETQVLVMEA